MTRCRDEVGMLMMMMMMWMTTVLSIVYELERAS